MAEFENLRHECISHLEAALDVEDPAEKDFHVRQALQLCLIPGDESDTDEA